ncbi:MAG: protein-glutamine glutaminase family protein [Limnohabitans sp.]|nr:protein-glutamine glutaminase family protein [Limnohabitans sp.]
MKNLILKLTLVIGIALFFTNCNKEENNLPELKPEKSSISEIGIVKKCTDCNNTESKTYFYCGIKAEASYLESNSPYISILTESSFKNTPVRVYFDEKNPSKIISVEYISETEKKLWETNIMKEDIPYRSIEELTKTSTLNKALSLTFTWTEAVNFFNAMKNSGCVPTNYANGCIPFQYANDGCYARAHAMRRYLNSINKDCYKYFAYGNLCVNTATSPFVCKVYWRYHVAPMIYTNNNWYIVDPSLFTAPVLYTTWLDKMKYNGATVTTTRSTNSGVYYYDYVTSTSTYDNNYTSTNSTMTNYRYRTTSCQ